MRRLIFYAVSTYYHGTSLKICAFLVEGYEERQRSPKKQAKSYCIQYLTKLKKRFGTSPLVVDLVAYPFISNALDYQISTKILRKVITSDDEEALLELLEAVKDYPETTRLLEKRLRELR